MATHPSTHRLHSDSFPTCPTRPELHGIPREERREADIAMAIADFVKSAGESFRVGWKIESNWTDPVLFATYQVIRPLASLLIVAFIVIIGAAAGASQNPAFYTQYLAWLIVGNAFYAFVLQIILGIISLLAIGYMLCAVNIVSNRMEFILGDSVSGIFFLLGGVIFPIALLPSYVQPISNVLPITYLLNAVRESFGLLPTASYVSDLAYLALTTLVTMIIGITVFRLAEQRAKKLGLFDRKSEY